MWFYFEGWEASLCHSPSDFSVLWSHCLSQQGPSTVSLSQNWSSPLPPWASLVTQMVKNLPAVQEIRVQSLGREDPLEKGMATHSGIPAWIIPRSGEPGGLQFMDCKESDTTERLTLFSLLTFSAIHVLFSCVPTTGQNVEFNDIFKNQLLLKINTSFKLVFLLICCPWLISFFIQASTSLLLKFPIFTLKGRTFSPPARQGKPVTSTVHKKYAMQILKFIPLYSSLWCFYKCQKES